MGIPVLCVRQFLGPVEELAGHHATVNHHDREPSASVVEDQAPGTDRIDQLLRAAFQEVAVDEHRKGLRADVDRRRARTEQVGPGRSAPTPAKSAGPPSMREPRVARIEQAG